jgi:predicted esterase
MRTRSQSYIADVVTGRIVGSCIAIAWLVGCGAAETESVSTRRDRGPSPGAPTREKPAASTADKDAPTSGNNSPTSGNEPPASGMGTADPSSPSEPMLPPTKPTSEGPKPTGDGGSSSPKTPDASAPPTPSTSATNGTGGATGFREAKSTGELSYQMNAAPPTGGKPQGLLVLLHGSTASNYTTFVARMADVAARYDLIRVSVLAPNGKGWNEGGNQAQVAAAELLHRLVQEDLYPKYNIDKTKVFFSGQSSGGGFLATNFVPAHAKDYQGGAFFQCGAAPPSIAFAPDATTKQKFKLHFEITTGDPIWPASYARAVTAYTAAGMVLSKDNTKAGGHCQFDQQQVIVDHIAAMLSP